jgi:hypothetical protein
MTSASYDAEAKEGLLSGVVGLKNNKANKWSASTKGFYLGTFDSKEDAALVRLTVNRIWIQAIDSCKVIQKAKELVKSVARKALIKDAKAQGQNGVFDAVLRELGKHPVKRGREMRCIYEDKFGSFVSEN